MTDDKNFIFNFDDWILDHYLSRYQLINVAKIFSLCEQTEDEEEEVESGESESEEESDDENETVGSLLPVGLKLFYYVRMRSWCVFNLLIFPLKQKKKGTQGLIEIENPNLVKQKNVKAKDADVSFKTKMWERIYLCLAASSIDIPIA